MAHDRSRRQSLLPWLVLAPLCAGAGVGAGLWWGGAPARGFGLDAVRGRPATERFVAVPSFAPIVERVRDAVVGIRTLHQKDPELMLQKGIVADLEPGGVSRGTGFVLHSDGLVVTAHHVIARPSMIVVEIPGVGPREAELIGEDPVTDTAVLRIVDPPPDLPALPLGRSEDVRQGDWVVTIGNPLSLRQSVGAGVVGYVGRQLEQDGVAITNEHLQFGAPAYPGSSGSPVLDLHGEVVGMTTRAAVEGEGFAFAVTSRVLRHVLASMEKNGGRVRRAQFGAGLCLARGGARVGAHPAAGGYAVQLSDVARGRAAARAGLQDGDVIVAIDGRPIASLSDFHDALTWSEPGTAVELDVFRGAERLGTVTVELGELGDPPQDLTQ